MCPHSLYGSLGNTRWHFLMLSNCSSLGIYVLEFIICFKVPLNINNSSIYVIFFSSIFEIIKNNIVRFFSKRISFITYFFNFYTCLNYGMEKNNWNTISTFSLMSHVHQLDKNLFSLIYVGTSKLPLMTCSLV